MSEKTKGEPRAYPGGVGQASIYAEVRDHLSLAMTMLGCICESSGTMTNCWMYPGPGGEAFTGVGMHHRELTAAVAWNSAVYLGTEVLEVASKEHDRDLLRDTRDFLALVAHALEAHAHESPPEGVRVEDVTDTLFHRGGELERRLREEFPDNRLTAPKG